MREPVTAVLQFEVDRGRLSGFERMKYIARLAMADTFKNGGTFVLVVSAEKITIVQRADADDLNTA